LGEKEERTLPAKILLSLDPGRAKEKGGIADVVNLFILDCVRGTKYKE
jgi:hypothetical protein